MKLLSLTTLRELARLSLPMVVSQGSFAVMVFTDRWFLAQLGAVHMAAAMGGGVAYFFCLSLFMGLVTYANALVAQYYGAGQFDKCPRVITQGFLLSLASLPLLALAWYLVDGSFALMGHDPQQVPLERTYFSVLMAGSFLTLVKACLASYFAGIGRTRVVMVTDVLGICVNIPLTYLLVFGKGGLPAMGIAGAAVGTLVANLFAVVLYFLFYLSRGHREQFRVLASFQYTHGIMRRYLRLGSPAALESFMNTATFNLFLLLFQGYGVVQGVAMSIVFNRDMLSFIPMVGLNIGVMSLIGRFVGAGDITRANQVISSGFILALSWSGTLAVLFLVFREPLVAVFATPDENFGDILRLGSLMMIGLTTYMMADAVILISGGALRGAGDTRWIMLTSISVHWLMLVVQYFVIVVWRLDALVSWWVFVGMLLTLALLYLRRLVGGRWRQPERLARVMAE